MAVLRATLSGFDAVLFLTPSLWVTGMRGSSPRETNLFTSVREGSEAEPTLTLPDGSLVVVVTMDLFLWAGPGGDLEVVLEVVMVLVRDLLGEEEEEEAVVECFFVRLMIIFLSMATARAEGPCAADASKGCETVLCAVGRREVVIEGL